MGTPVSVQILDRILALQLLVAWAGEGRCEPKRLGWWDTDLVDREGGGDLMSRLLPRTYAWAGLEATREAARRIDEKARKRMGDPDKLRSIFFLGFAHDEALGDRLAMLKRSGQSPVEALELGLVQQKFSKDSAASAFEHKDVTFTVVPNGRHIKGAMPDDVGEMVKRLVAGLVPLAEAYPLPFYKVGG